MKFISADWLLTCDDNFTIMQNAAIVFDEKILEIDTIEKIQTKYPNETIKYLGKNSVLMPGLINAHVHLEFSANKTTLKYGNFVQWLFSVMLFCILSLKLNPFYKYNTLPHPLHGLAMYANLIFLGNFTWLHHDFKINHNCSFIQWKKDH